MSIALPQRFVDISDFRPIPDHQEVRELDTGGYPWVPSSTPPPRPPLAASTRRRPPPQKNAVQVDPLQVFSDASLDQSLVVEIVVRFNLPCMPSSRRPGLAPPQPPRPPPGHCRRSTSRAPTPMPPNTFSRTRLPITTRCTRRWTRCKCWGPPTPRACPPTATKRWWLGSRRRPRGGRAARR